MAPELSPFSSSASPASMSASAESAFRCKDLFVDIKDALVLLAPQATMREGQTKREVLRIALGSLLQVRDRDEVVAHAVVGHAEQDDQPLVAGVLLQLGGEGLDGVFEVLRLEEGKAEVHLQAGQCGVQLERVAVVGDGFAVVLLTRLEQDPDARRPQRYAGRLLLSRARQPPLRRSCPAAPERVRFGGRCFGLVALRNGYPTSVRPATMSGCVASLLLPPRLFCANLF